MARKLPFPRAAPPGVTMGRQNRRRNPPGRKARWCPPTPSPLRRQFNHGHLRRGVTNVTPPIDSASIGHGSRPGHALPLPDRSWWNAKKSPAEAKFFSAVPSIALQLFENGLDVGRCPVSAGRNRHFKVNEMGSTSVTAPLAPAPNVQLPADATPASAPVSIASGNLGFDVSGLKPEDGGSRAAAC
jgi:hypothetical protein